MVTCTVSQICWTLWSVSAYLRLSACHTASHLSAMEGTMEPTIKQPSTPQSVDRKVLLLLRRKGAQTLEGLTMLTGIGWGQVFLSVDRLSRTGKVSLTPVYPSEYRVSVDRAVQ
jgi:hypothetical protein